MAPFSEVGGLPRTLEVAAAANALSGTRA
jgi:hypothetical protein